MTQEALGLGPKRPSSFLFYSCAALSHHGRMPRLSCWRDMPPNGAQDAPANSQPQSLRHVHGAFWDFLAQPSSRLNAASLNESL